MDPRRRALIVASALTPWLCPSTSFGAPGPLKSAQLLVGFPAGSTPDVLARRVGDRITKTYAQTIVVENRAGAGGQLAVIAAKAGATDGSCILLTPMSMLGVYPHTYKRLPYDPLADLSPVCMGVTYEYAIAVGPAVPATVTDLHSLLAWVKEDPKRASFGSPAIGSTLHFVIELLGKASGVPLIHVGYRGSGPAMQDMIGGNLPALCAPVGSFLNQPRVRVLATSGAKRNRFMPNVPTMAEQGFPDMVYSEWYGFFVPAKTPAERIQQLNTLLREALEAPDVAATLATFGMEATPSTPVELGKALALDTQRWGGIVKRIGFTADS